MHLRLTRSLVPLLAGAFFATAALAVGAPFSRTALEATQQAGKPVLVAIHADWCGTCRAQEPVIEALLKSPKYAGFTVYRVDFDRQKDAVRRFSVQYQSTLIVFKGAREVSRSTAQTAPGAIAAQLDKAL